MQMSAKRERAPVTEQDVAEAPGIVGLFGGLNGLLDAATHGLELAQLGEAPRQPYPRHHGKNAASTESCLGKAPGEMLDVPAECRHGLAVAALHHIGMAHVEVRVGLELERVFRPGDP